MDETFPCREMQTGTSVLKIKKERRNAQPVVSFAGSTLKSGGESEIVTSEKMAHHTHRSKVCKTRDYNRIHESSRCAVTSTCAHAGMKHLTVAT